MNENLPNPFEWQDEYNDRISKLEKQNRDLHVRVSLLIECVTGLMQCQKQNSPSQLPTTSEAKFTKGDK